MKSPKFERSMSAVPVVPESVWPVTEELDGNEVIDERRKCQIFNKERDEAGGGRDMHSKHRSVQATVRAPDKIDTVELLVQDLA